MDCKKTNLNKLYYGEVKFFDLSKKFGFITKDKTDYYIKSSILDDISLFQGDGVIFSYKHFKNGRNQVSEIFILPRKGNEEYSNYFEREDVYLFFKKIKHLNAEDVRIIRYKYSYVFKLFLEYLTDKNAKSEYKKFLIEAKSIINNFNLNEVISKLNVSIQTHSRNKIGGDDSFTVIVKSEIEDNADPYITHLLEIFGKEVIYRESGFYPVSSMELDFEDSKREKVESELKIFREKFKKQILIKYSKEYHLEELIYKFQEEEKTIFYRKFDWNNI